MYHTHRHIPGTYAANDVIHCGSKPTCPGTHFSACVHSGQEPAGFAHKCHGLRNERLYLIGMWLCVSRDIRESAHQQPCANDEDPRPMHPCMVHLGPRVGISVPVVCPRSRVLPSPDDHSCPGKGQARLTFPRSRMKQSPLLKLSQDTGTSVARTTRRPLTWKSLCTTTSLGTTCLNPDATPPFCQAKEQC